MIQFYFLSILLNAVAGYAILVSLNPESESFDALRSVMTEETFRLVLGVLTMATGFFKLLSAVRGDVPVIGDLFPAVAGLSAGFILIFEFYRSRSSVSSGRSDKIEAVFLHNRKWFAYAALSAAALHFLFPTVLVL